MSRERNGRRRKWESFVLITRHMMGHESWLDLDPGARCIYLEIRKLFNGQNNGEVFLSCRDAAKIAKCSKGTASNHFKSLVAHGFIKTVSKGHFGNKHATSWILTNEVYQGRPATNEWQKWKKAVPASELSVPTSELKLDKIPPLSSTAGTYSAENPVLPVRH